MTVQDVDFEATMAAKLAIAKKICHLEKDELLNSSPFLNSFLILKYIYIIFSYLGCLHFCV
ncbi:hypothetical protein KFK09_011467 [Dendrobium nobile]|uniref:Uncharacterized protein n=1 Tax=Dendrobium nobile TaxID=94219 RepID=A0A8T3BF29_DENNO|nr:hypothetical protein KFK09_011467 [Dendrobium nobile]